MASSGHPVDGSAQVADEGGLCSSFHSAGFVPLYAGPLSGHVRKAEVGLKNYMVLLSWKHTELKVSRGTSFWKK